MNIVVNDFVKRQTPESRFSHFEGSWEDLLKSVWWGFWADQSPGYRPGVVCVRLSPIGFYSGVISLKAGDTLSGGFKSRQPGEDPRKFITALEGEKAIAKSVQIILYSSKVLSEDNDNQLPPEDGNWEIISINASPEEGEMPIDPSVLMHNHFGSDGGTDTHMSDAEFVSTLRESFRFWSDKAMFKGE